MSPAPPGHSRIGTPGLPSWLVLAGICVCPPADGGGDGDTWPLPCTRPCLGHLHVTLRAALTGGVTVIPSHKADASELQPSSADLTFRHSALLGLGRAWGQPPAGTRMRYPLPARSSPGLHASTSQEGARTARAPGWGNLCTNCGL